MDYFMPVSRELTEFYRERTRGMKVKCKYISHYLEKIPQENSDLTGKKDVYKRQVWHWMFPARRLTINWMSVSAKPGKADG